MCMIQLQNYMMNCQKLIMINPIVYRTNTKKIVNINLNNLWMNMIIAQGQKNEEEPPFEEEPVDLSVIR